VYYRHTRTGIIISCKTMRNFFIQSYSTYKGLFYWLNWPGYISNIFLYPIIMVLMYSILGRFALNPEAAQFYAIGVSLSAVTFVTISGITQTYAYDRDSLTISFIFVSTTNRVVHFLSRPLLHYPNAILVYITAMLTVWLAVDLDFGLLNWLGFVVVSLVISASICAFSQFLGIFSIITRDWLNTMSFTVGILFAFTGIIIPIDVFPSAVQELARLLPITNGLSATRLAFMGAPFSDIYTLIIREAITGIVYFTIGTAGFLIFEKVAKRTGILEIESLG
jgi:ABC-2 type transport system permease protein